MRTKYLLSALGVLAFLALGAVATGCGSGDDSASTSADDSASTSAESAEESEATSSTSAPAAGGKTLTVKMDEYKFIPENAKAKAGPVTIDAVNIGDMPHELVLAKSDLDPAKLPTTGDGSVDEEALDVVGEAPDVASGETGSFSADLEPGSYVMICNLPGHYSSGMYGSLTVK